MAKSMVIVESPAKARTIGRYLGRDFVVRACAGHIKDLPKKTLGVDIEDDFRPTYEIIAGKEKVIRELRKIAGNSDTIYLAADPDREGEAICQHLAEELGGNGRFRRILFNEITKNAIQTAFETPGEINQDKVAAQQARRILDRLVGYQISPLLWKKVRRGLSAGRVQSVALRMIVDRELEIRAFVSEEYWNFTAELLGNVPPSFESKAVKLDGKKFQISNQQEADDLLAGLKSGEFVVEDVRRKERKRNPVPPFVTSKLQQEASRKLRFTVKKTMMIAQRLYEGKEMGDGESVGLITYMRTDSTRVSSGALDEARSFIENQYGKPYLPAKPQNYRSGKAAQDAHEAIRPTSVERRPETVQAFLDRDEYRLYDLIWKRFVASQMKPAVFDQTEIDISAPRTLFRTVGSILKFDGFLKVYQEGRDDSDAAEDADQGRLLPPIKKGETLQVLKILPEQKFTQPPMRYSEATLVKALEEKGIGRPSTYSQIISVIQDREYVEKNEQRRFQPTETGEVVSQLLVENFEDIFDYDYTARLEKDLDDIEKGRDWVSALKGFYGDFSRELVRAQKAMKDFKREEKPAGFDCEKCGSPMVIKWGRFGSFIACSNFPECRNTKEVKKEEAPAEATAQVEDVDPCEKCGKPMARKKGRFGEFLACTGYPECKNTRRLVKVDGQEAVVKDELLEEKCPDCGARMARKQGRYGAFVACSNYPDCRYIKQEKTGVRCPDCQEGDIVEKKSRRGKLFYSCNRYPKCKFVLWKKPIAETCPQCGNPYLLLQISKKTGTSHTCNNADCDYTKPVEDPGQ